MTVDYFGFTEGDILRLAPDQVQGDWLVKLHEEYPGRFEIDFPNPLKGRHYSIRTRGYAGVVALGRGAVLEIEPKIGNGLLVEMMECAHAIPRINPRVVPTSIGELCEFWAGYLATKVLERSSKGLFWDYAERESEVQWVRGRLLPVGTGASVYPKCRYAEHTADILANRILAATLDRLRGYPFRNRAHRTKVLKAWKILSPLAHQGISSGDCAAMTYHPLNRDYEPLHALCKVLLEHRSPGRRLGRMGHSPAFTIHMPSLFEEFCAQFLKEKLAGKLNFVQQYHSRLKGSRGHSFRMDLAVFDHLGAKPLAVIDAKYKSDGSPLEGDIQQVVAYAVQLGVKRAFLLYPFAGYDQRLEVGPISVRAIGFDMGAGDIDRAGAKVVREIMDIL